MEPDLDMSAIFERLEGVTPENIDISSHFPPEELQSMSDIEQSRFKSIKLNYLVMKEFGTIMMEIFVPFVGIDTSGSFVMSEKNP